MKEYIIIYKHARSYYSESGYCVVLNEDQSLRLFTLGEARQLKKKLADKNAKIIEI